MDIVDTSTPVVILKLEHYGSLGIARSLGQWGILVAGVDANPGAPTFRSRYCANPFVWNLDGEDPAGTVNVLLTIHKKLGRRALLIPTSDETAQFVATYADPLREGFMFPCQPAELVRSLCSKKSMFFLVKSLGLPTAECFFPRTRAEVLRFSRQARFPLMLKGINGGLLEKRTGKKMVIVRNEYELIRFDEAMEDHSNPNLMMQEYIPGGDDSVWMFNGYFNANSECLFGFTGKKIRQNPVYTGMTSLGVCLPNEVVTQLTLRLAKAIGYRGILDIGFRYDSRDNQYKVLDVNPRIGATFRLFVGKQGMDVARAMYLDMTGQEVPADNPSWGRKWIVEDKDLRSTYCYFRDGNLAFSEWLGSFRGIEEAGYFSLRDPIPFLAMCLTHLKRSVQRLTARLFLRHSLPAREAMDLDDRVGTGLTGTRVEMSSPAGDYRHA